MDEKRLKLIRDAQRTIDLYSRDGSPNHQNFMDQLVKNGFYVSNLNSAEPTSIFDHLDVFGSDPNSPFSKRYQAIFRNPNAIKTNRRVWVNYLNQIRSYLDYLSSPSLAPARNAYAEHAISSFGQNNLPGQASSDIEGSKSIITARKSGIEGSQSIISGRKVLTEPKEKLLTTGMEAFRADETSPTPGSGPHFPSIGRRILNPSPEVAQARNEALEEGKFQLEMGARKGEESLKDVIGAFAGGVAREVSSLGAPEGGEVSEIAYEPVEYQESTSSGQSVPSVRNIPRVIKRVRGGVRGTGAGSAATNKAASMAAQRGAVVAGEAAAEAAAAANPVSWIVIGVIIIMVFLLLFFASDSFHDVQNTALCGLPDTPCGKTPSQTVETQNVVAVLKTCDPAVAQGADINCNISVTYTGAGVADIELTDTVPAGTTFKSYSPADPKTTSKVGDIITWDLNNVPSNTPQIFFLTYTAPNQDIWIPNTASVKVTSTSVNPNGDINTPPNQDTCGGKYGPGHAIEGGFPHGNFGDPNCDFTIDALVAELQKDDQLNSLYWFDTVIRLESSYDPNAYLAASTSGKGANGLFQMNPCGNGNHYPPDFFGGGIDPYDCGNVVWQLQIQNAVKYENELENCMHHPAGPWMYWASARPRWTTCP